MMRVPSWIFEKAAFITPVIVAVDRGYCHAYPHASLSHSVSITRELVVSMLKPAPASISAGLAPQSSNISSVYPDPHERMVRIDNRKLTRISFFKPVSSTQPMPDTLHPPLTHRRYGRHPLQKLLLLDQYLTISPPSSVNVKKSDNHNPTPRCWAAWKECDEVVKTLFGQATSTLTDQITESASNSWGLLLKGIYGW